MKFEPRYSENNVNVPSHNHFSEFIRQSLWLLGIVFGIYFVLGYAVDRFAERLPAKFETAIAAGITSSFDHGDFPRTKKYLQKVLDSLLTSAEGLPPFTYKVSILDQAAVNAVALPAGNIVVFKGLLSELKSDVS